MAGWDLAYVRRAFASGQYRLTLHGESEREADLIFVTEIEEAFTSPYLEMIEDYPTDPRGRSGLFLGFTKQGLPLHAVLGLSAPDIVVVVTVYRPDPRLWDNWRNRSDV
ncbi:MAG: DUF4258 domain-containing protein [Dehalococcoidia bacterium]